jgi:argininosuccinate lyase
MRRTTVVLDGAFIDLERTLLDRAEADSEAVMPGMTHTQPAQPVLLAHHLLAYVEMLERDRGRFRDAWSRADRSPLGAGAIAGAGFPLDREAAAAELGLAAVTANSIDAVGDRDFVVEALAAAALAMVHLSRLAEELVWWSSPVVGWVVMDDAWSTGSSMMPNKKNPDPSELIRGRASRVAGELSGVLGVLKGLPLGYQRDLQETVAPFLDALAVLESSLLVMAGVMGTLTFRPERMRAAALEGYVTATALADALVEHGVPFRNAHGLVGRLVAEAETRGLRLDELPDAAFTAIFGDDVPKPIAGDELRAAATLEAALARPRVTGGTSPDRVREALRAARARLDAEGQRAGA